ncbi:cytochrome P450 [Bailinhaonella thermotolerans]|uniref:Cytochrome P450 n=2 Tax=Bailinhaonella thermotolerans TaxID=1070861 RepID=A0A3A4AXL3_9ACTN|nr:cytochrome P450 [Bailinhaonella thermotolerans]
MDPELLRDPFTAFSRIRESAPVAPAVFGDAPSRILVVTRYDDVRTVLADRRFVNNPANVPGANAGNVREQLIAMRRIPPEYAKYILGSVLDSDGEDHIRLRRLVSRAFTARRVLDLRPRVEEITAALIETLPDMAGEDGVVDLVEHFAYPLPITVICELVGIPEEDRGHWREWSRGLNSVEPGAITEPLKQIVANSQALIAHRREHPADDLLTALIRAHDEDGDRLTDVELVTMIITLMVAGHETTAHLISNGVEALLTHPDQLERFRAAPALAPRAVHELMRWCGPVQGTQFRYPTEDVTLSGVLIPKGTPVMAILVGANRDPRHYPDPDRLDITRDPGAHRETHVGFGHGLHYCLGAALARQEAEVALTRLFAAYPGLSLAVPRESLRRDFLPASWRLTALPVHL